MSSDRKSGRRGVARWLCRFTAAVLATVPALALGADIAWKATIDSGTMGGGKFSRLGSAVLTTGEKAELKVEGVVGPNDEKGRSTNTVDAVMRFKDGSSITTRYAGFYDPKTLEMGGKGEFVIGTGKYQGITGQFSYTGHQGDTKFVGAYTLKK